MPSSRGWTKNRSAAIVRSAERPQPVPREQQIRCNDPQCDADASSETGLCEVHFKPCCVEDCLRQAQNGPRDNDRCVGHMSCASPECQGQAPYEFESATDSSPYCHSHRCSMRSCKYLATTIMPTSARSCADHARITMCAADGCDGTRFDPSSASLYCAAHMYCSNASCKRPRCINNEFCTWHNCDRNGCNNGVATAMTTCPEHTCKANIEDGQKCTKPTTSYIRAAEPDWLDYCALHICEVNTRMGIPCTNENNNRSYCTLHRCSEPGCDHPRPLDPQRTHRLSTKTECTCHQDTPPDHRGASEMEEQMSQASTFMRFTGFRPSRT